MNERQLYGGEKKPVPRSERIHLGLERAAAFIPLTQYKGAPMSYGSGKVREKS